MEPAPLVRVYPPCFTFWRASGARLLGAGPRPCRPPGGIGISRSERLDLQDQSRRYR